MYISYIVFQAKAKESFKMKTINPGDFSFMSELERVMLTDAYNAITLTASWDVMKNDPGNSGYMFSNHVYM